MLAGILPGVRELRPPLAGGYLWLLFLWLALGDKLPTKEEVKAGPVERLYELEPVVSSLGLAVVASVAAYMIGSLAIEGQGFLRELIARAVIRRFMRRAEAPRFPAVIEMLLPSLDPDLDNVGAEQRDIAKTRLLDLSEALHAEVDRPDSEASFRAALWPPISALVLYDGFALDWLWFLALLLPAALIWQWLIFRRRAEIALRVAAEARPEIMRKPPKAPPGPTGSGRH